jgi:hypothetical protein
MVSDEPSAWPKYRSGHDATAVAALTLAEAAAPSLAQERMVAPRFAAPPVSTAP